MIKDDYGNTKFYGVYRAIVADTSDPQKQKRIKVQVPQVLFDTESGWAWPIGPTSGTSVSTPAVGDGVFIVFEGGDPSFPLWLGNFA